MDTGNSVTEKPPSGSDFADSPSSAQMGIPEVSHLSTCRLPTEHGVFSLQAFRVGQVASEIIALVKGDLSAASPTPPLVRLHSQCLTGDVLGSRRCDCGEQLQASLAAIAADGRGILLYLPQEGRGIGLLNKLQAYSLQDQGLNTIQANLALGLPVDAREYRSAAALLLHLGLVRIRLMTNNPEKCRQLEENGVQVIERVPIVVPANAFNQGYMQTKADLMGHDLQLDLTHGIRTDS